MSVIDELHNNFHCICIGGANKAALQNMISMVPLRRLGTRTEIAESCLFLLSPLSSNTTGTVLVADGGESLATFDLSVLSKL